MNKPLTTTGVKTATSVQVVRTLHFDRASCTARASIPRKTSVPTPRLSQGQQTLSVSLRLAPRLPVEGGELRSNIAGSQRVGLADPIGTGGLGHSPGEVQPPRGAAQHTQWERGGQFRRQAALRRNSPLGGQRSTRSGKRGGHIQISISAASGAWSDRCDHGLFGSTTGAYPMALRT